MDRSNPYEAAFEAYLQAQGLCYIGIDESRRAVLGDVPIKNLDFIVLGARGQRLLVDVKGRRFPGGPRGKERYVWENWATQGDIDGIGQWMRLFGREYHGLFVFLYHVLPAVTVSEATPDLFNWRGERYLLRAVAVDDYRRHMSVRSPSWGTVHVRHGMFRVLARPFRHFTHELSREEEEPPHGQEPARHFPEISRLAHPVRPGGGAEAGGVWA